VYLGWTAITPSMSSAPGTQRHELGPMSVTLGRGEIDKCSCAYHSASVVASSGEHTASAP
jgi:hypothetical protein